MTPMLFDPIIVSLILLSVALGFMRGFCNEAFTILGWVAAIIATIYFMPVLKVYGRELIEKDWLADLATSSAIFLVTLGVFSAVSYYATRTLHASRLGIIDRSLGFGFGILRAIVLLGLGYILFSFVYSKSENQPEFITQARTKPFLENSAEWVQAVLPLDVALGDKEDSIDKVMKPDIDKAVKDIKAETPSGDQLKDALKEFAFPQTPAPDAKLDADKPPEEKPAAEEAPHE